MNEGVTSKTLEEENRALKKKNASLLEKLVLWEFALEGAELGTWTWDLRTDVMTIDSNAENILGFKPDCNSEWDTSIHQDDIDDIKNMDADLKSGRLQNIDCTYRIVSKSGEIGWIHDQGKVVSFDKEGKPVRAAGTICDITDQKKSVEKSFENEKALRLSLDAANAGTWRWDIITGEVIWDETMQKIFGMEPGTFDGTFEAWKKCVHPDDLKSAEQATLDALEHNRGYEYEYRIRSVSGEWRIVNSQAATLRDDRGKPVRMFGFARDITEQKMAEIIKFKNAERLQLALQGANLGMWDYEILNDKYTLNSRASELLGHKIRNDAEWSSIIHPDDRKRIREKSAWPLIIHSADCQKMFDVDKEHFSVKDSDYFFDVEYRVNLKDKEIRWISDRGC